MNSNIYTTATYRTSDPLNNLKLRFRVKKIVLAELTDVKTSAAEDPHSAVEMSPLGEATMKSTVLNPVLEKTFQWQQKKELTAEEKSTQSMALFTFVDRDEFFDQRELIRSFTTSQGEDPTPATIKLFTKPITSQTTADQPDRQPEKADENKEFQQMHIMLGVPMKADASKWDQYTLCYIQGYSDGGITMRPGLTHHTPHRLRSLDGEEFEFTIENVSEIFNPNSTKSQANKAEQAFFSMLQRYIEYFVDLLDDWISVPSHAMTHVSHVSQTTPKSNSFFTLSEPVAHFGFPFEFHLEASREGNQQLWYLTCAVETRPKLYFEVCSYDYWDRRRVEGYGYMSLPFYSGDYDVKVPTWIPGNSIRQQLHYFFTGATPELADVKYVAVPSGSTNLVNKFGFETRSSGTIRVRMNVVIMGGPVKEKKNQHETVEVNQPVTETAVRLTKLKMKLQELRRAKKYL